MTDSILPQTQKNVPIQTLIDTKLRQSVVFSPFDQKLETLGQRGGIIACVLIVLASIAISFSVLRQTALHLGFNWWQAILWPSLVDGVILTMSLMLIRRSRLRLASGWHWALLVTTEITSIAINAAHGADIGLMAILAHALPPVMLFFLTKIISIDVKDNAMLQGTVLTLDELFAAAKEAQADLKRQAQFIEDKRAEIDDMTAKAEALQQEVKQLQNERRKAKNTPRSDKKALTTKDTEQAAIQFMRNCHSEGRKPSGAEVGRHIGRSDSLGRRLLRENWDVITANNIEVVANGNGVHNE